MAIRTAENTVATLRSQDDAELAIGTTPRFASYGRQYQTIPRSPYAGATDPYEPGKEEAWQRMAVSRELEDNMWRQEALQAKVAAAKERVRRLEARGPRRTHTADATDHGGGRRGGARDASDVDSGWVRQNTTASGTLLPWAGSDATSLQTHSGTQRSPPKQGVRGVMGVPTLRQSYLSTNNTLTSFGATPRTNIIRKMDRLTGKHQKPRGIFTKYQDKAIRMHQDIFISGRQNL